MQSRPGLETCGTVSSVQPKEEDNGRSKSTKGSRRYGAAHLRCMSTATGGDENAEWRISWVGLTHFPMGH